MDDEDDGDNISLESELEESKETLLSLLPIFLLLLNSTSTSSSSTWSSSCAFSSLSDRVMNTMERRMTTRRSPASPSSRDMARLPVEGSPGYSCLGLQERFTISVNLGFVHLSLESGSGGGRGRGWSALLYHISIPPTPSSPACVQSQ